MHKICCKFTIFGRSVVSGGGINTYQSVSGRKIGQKSYDLLPFVKRGPGPLDHRTFVRINLKVYIFPLYAFPHARINKSESPLLKDNTC